MWTFRYFLIVQVLILFMVSVFSYFEHKLCYMYYLFFQIETPAAFQNSGKKRSWLYIYIYTCIAIKSRCDCDWDCWCTNYQQTQSLKASFTIWQMDIHQTTYTKICLAAPQTGNNSQRLAILYKHWGTLLWQVGGEDLDNYCVHLQTSSQGDERSPKSGFFQKKIAMSCTGVQISLRGKMQLNS